MYKLKTMKNSIVYPKMVIKSQLLRFYYYVSQKNHSKTNKTWVLTSNIMHFYKIITTFHKQ